MTNQTDIEIEVPAHPPMDVEEIDILEFDFTKAIRAGESLTSAVLDVSMTLGADPSPSLLKVGTLTTVGNVAFQKVQGRARPAIYHLRCKGAFAPDGRVVTIAVDLPVGRF